MLHILNRVTVVVGLFAGTCVTAAEMPREKLQATIDAALDVIYSDCCTEMSDLEKQAEVSKTVEANYDLDVIIRRAIGRNWEFMSEAEQTRVLSLVKELVLKAYVKGLEGKARPKVTLGEVIKISDKRMEIKSTIVLDNKTYYVLYRLGKMPSGWQIYDIVAENVSVVSNYREQIDDHFRRGTGAELITRLEELLAKNTIDEDTHL
jgi:phospholipid transport system substrate-binding protein